MKNLFVALIALFGVSQSQATSLHPDTFKNIRLSFQFSPLREFHHLPAGTTGGHIYLRNDGRVVRYSNATRLTPRPPQLLKTLSKSELVKIERLISQAALGELVRPTIFCRAIPMERVDYQADGFKLILKQGAEPCGIKLYNDSPAADKLVEFLDRMKNLSEGLEMLDSAE